MRGKFSEAKLHVTKQISLEVLSIWKPLQSDIAIFTPTVAQGINSDSRLNRRWNQLENTPRLATIIPAHTMDPTLQQVQGLRIAVEGCVSPSCSSAMIHLTFNLGPWYSGCNLCLGRESL